MIRSRAVAAALSLLVGGPALLVATAPAAQATGETAGGSALHVDIGNPACSDTAAGTGTAAQPYCTLQAATGAAQPGDTVHVAAGGVYPATEVTGSGGPGAPLTITGDGAFSVAGLTLSGVHDVALSGMRAGLTLSGNGIRVVDSSHVTLDGLTLTGAQGTTLVAISGTSSGVTVSRSRLTSTLASVITVGAGVSGTVLTTNYVNGDTVPAVELDGAVGTEVTSNTFDPTVHPLDVLNGSSGTTVENNEVLGGTIEVSADSAAGTTTAYNLFDIGGGRAPYLWAGTAYGVDGDLTAFRTATGQGHADLTGTLTHYMVPPREGAKSIDSADTDAPGEQATDIDGNPRVDDPLVDNTGTGTGAGGSHADRGAFEFQDPYRARHGTWTPPQMVAVGYPITYTVESTNPWHTSVPRTYDFGDGTPLVTSTADSVQHTYADSILAGRSRADLDVTVTDDGVSWTDRITVNPPGPLTADIHLAQEKGRPLGVTVEEHAQSPFPFSTCTIDFGDGTVQTRDWMCDRAEHVYAAPGSYTVTATQNDYAGRSVTVSDSITVGPVFVPLAPTRLLDTRTGLGAPKARVGDDGIVQLNINGAAGIAEPTSVLLNITVTGPSGSGYISAYPGGTAPPATSALNYRAGQTVANLVTVPVGFDGTVNLYNSAGSVDLIADVEGYTTASEPGGTGTVLYNDGDRLGEFRPVLDTRGNSGLLLPKLGKVGPGGTVTFQALDQNSTSVDTNEDKGTAVVLSVTETNATATSYVTAYRTGTARPTASTLNFAAGESRSTTVVVPVDANGEVTLYNHAGSVDLIASVEGFYVPLGVPVGPVTYVADHPTTSIVPVRVLDTRSGLGARKGPLPHHSTLSFKVAGVPGIPADATGVWVNITAVAPTANGYLTTWGDVNSMPPGSSLNVMRGTVTPVLLYLPIAHGYASTYNAYGSVDVVADVEGYTAD